VVAAASEAKVTTPASAIVVERIDGGLVTLGESLAVGVHGEADGGMAERLGLLNQGEPLEDGHELTR
jgi:hypothetical protein